MLGKQRLGMYDRARCFGTVVACVVLLAACSGDGAAGQGISVNSQGLALDGYDAMSYYQSGPRVGNPDYRYDYEGATFLFASAVNREKFASSPETFMPQYGGYCALGMGYGALVEGDPEAYTLEDGKLYLSASAVVKHLWRWLGDVDESDSEWRSLAEDP